MGIFFPVQNNQLEKKLSTNFFQKRVFEIDTYPGNLFVLKILLMKDLTRELNKQSKINHNIYYL